MGYPTALTGRQQRPTPMVSISDSQSMRSALSQSDLHSDSAFMQPILKSKVPSIKLPSPGIFPVNFANLFGHNARIAPYEIDKIPSKICRPGINISCGLGS